MTPKEDSFYDLFAISASHRVAGAWELTNLLAAVDPESRATVVQRMRDLEHEADEATHEIMNRVSSFLHHPVRPGGNPSPRLAVGRLHGPHEGGGQPHRPLPG